MHSLGPPSIEIAQSRVTYTASAFAVLPSDGSQPLQQVPAPVLPAANGVRGLVVSPTHRRHRANALASYGCCEQAHYSISAGKH